MDKFSSFKKSFENALIRSKREREEITVIAVSKKKSIEDIKPIINAGHIDFGENKFQEIESKWPTLKNLNKNVRIHYVGSIQSKKTKQIFEHCDVIHSIDRLKIVHIIKDLELENKVQKEYFIQINTGDEEQKSGVKLNDAEKFISDSFEKYQFKISGLMCLPPINDKPEKHFNTLRGLAENFKIPYLSMGMSNDFELALMCGATHIRVGTLIFGERN